MNETNRRFCSPNMKKFTLTEIMMPVEACERWGITQEKFRKTIERQPEKIEKLIQIGLMKYYQKTPQSRKKWMVSTDAMRELFGSIKKEG